MKAVQLSTSGTSTSAVYAVNNNVNSPINISVAIRVTGTVAYNLEYTYDDVYAPGFTQSGSTWFNHPTLAAAQTTTKDATFGYPVTGIRINQTSGSGSTAATVIQTGIQ
jgi:glucosamine 6-phosphate synthetase-like amidotransferase/phosphosugar isomerase protein